MSEDSIALPSDEALKQLGMGALERGKEVFKARLERHYGQGRVPPIRENA